MKWFKHYSDNYRGRSIEELYSELGHTGIACYYLITELCTEKLEAIQIKSVGKPELRLSFSLGFVRRNLRISQGKLEKFLRFSQGLGLFSYEISKKDLHIEYPILLDLLDSDQKRARSRREQDAHSPRLELDKERDKDKEREVEIEFLSKSTKSPPKEKPNTELNRKVWQAYSDAYSQRYKVEPTRNATVNAQISQLAKRLGEDAIEIIKFYLTHNDGFYLSKTHSIGPCLRDAESLRTQWLRNKPITKTTVRQFEQMQQYEETARHIREHGV